MTQEAYCSFEISKLLQEKGFEAGCRTCYTSDGIFLYLKFAIRMKDVAINSECAYLAPTHQLAIRWLREEKYILLFILPAEDRAGNLAYSGAIFTWDEENGIYSPSWESKTYPVYEQAVEESLKYILEFLI